MSLLANLKTDENIENEKDVVGGFQPLESNVYQAKVNAAYLNKSQGGALGLVLHLQLEGREHRETLWVASGDAKGNKNYYETKDGERRYLPGFNVANSLCLLTVGKEIGEMDTEKKVVKVFSYEAKAEVPTEVDMLTDLMGQEIIAGILHQIVDKNAKGDDGQYRPTGETRDENVIDKFFRASDGMTTAEIRAGAENAAFVETWKGRFVGDVRDRSTGAAGQAGAPAGQAGAPAANSGGAQAGKKPTNSLFG